MNRAFWKNKNVFITGYEGFLGSNLTRRLLDCGANILGLDISTHRKNTILTKKELKKINVVKGSVENLKLLRSILEKNKIDIIFHLAAKSLVEECLCEPRRAFSTNIQGTWNICEAARNINNVKAIVIASSDKAYGDHAQLPYMENAPLSGRHPYDVSKSCADLIAHTYFHTYKLPVAVTRCGNVYGPGDFNFSRLVPETIRCAITDKPLLIRSDGKFTRDYIHIEDVLTGYVRLAETMQDLKLFGEAFNFSNEKPISVIDLVKKVYELSDRKPDYKILGRAKYEIKHQYLSSRKAKRILSWRPRYSLDYGLSKTIKWYKDCFNCR